MDHTRLPTGSCRYISALVGLALIEGCATVASGDYGVALDPHNQPARSAEAGSGLRISAGEIGDLASRYFGAIEVTFENNSPTWVQIDKVDLDFGTPDKNRSVLIPWGADIDTWEQATRQRNAIEYVNKQTALALLAFGGGLLQAGGGRRTSAQIGGVVAAGAVGALVAQDLTDKAQAAQRVGRFPDTHLLDTPIRIPPGLFVKRWLLLYTAERPVGGCVDSVILGYETVEHRHERVLLKFKDALSKWQTESCGGDRALLGSTARG